jgi:hypothetical protein
MTTWLLIAVPALVLPIVLLLSFAGCALVAPLDEHVATQPRFAPRGIPRCTISDTGFTCDGTIMNLGSGSVDVRLDVTGSWRYRCNGQSSGHGPVIFPPDSLTQTYGPNKFTNGQLEFTSAYTFVPDLSQAKCNVGQPSFRDVTFTSITLTITQDGRHLFTCRTLPGAVLSPGQVLLDCGP